MRRPVEQLSDQLGLRFGFSHAVSSPPGWGTAGPFPFTGLRDALFGALRRSLWLSTGGPGIKLKILCP